MDEPPRNLAATLGRRLALAELELLRRLGALAERSGERAYLVGGVVRDLLLERDVTDLDVTVAGDGQRLAEAVARERGGRVVKHSAFKTAEVRLPDGLRLDLATTRRESYSAPAALPRVARGDLAQDLARRDFTINALAVDLSEARFGDLIDPHDGVRDLVARRLRVLHSASFLDDPTRAFRAVRFAVRLGFVLNAETQSLIGEALQAGAFDRLSAERLRREVKATFDEPRAGRVVELAQRLGLLGAVDRALRPDREAFRRLDAAQRILRRHHRRHDEATVDWAVAFGALIADLGAAARTRMAERLRPERPVSRILLEAPPRVSSVLAGIAAPPPRRAARVHAACREQPLEILLLALVASGDDAARRALWRYLDVIRGIRLDITGDDLIAAGVPEGPAVAAGLAAALDARLAGHARSAERQLAVALKGARLTVPGASIIP